jgi:hypothetical protein
MAVRSGLTPAREAAKALAKELIWYSLTRFEQGDEKNICLFTTRRSGGTMLMEMLAADEGSRWISQPDSIYTASPWQIRRLPVVEKGQFISLDEETEDRFRRYFAEVLGGTLQVNAPWRFWRRDFVFTGRRLVLKIGSAKALIDWFEKQFPVRIVYSTRHPIPTARSIIRNGWGLTAQAYLNDRAFVDEHLGEERLAGCRSILAEGTPLERQVLNWGLENLVPVKGLSEHPERVYVSYEELMLSTESTVSRLSGALDLGDTARMLQKIRTPSQTSGRSTSRTVGLIKRGDRGSLVSGWRAEVTEDEEKRCLELLEFLGIPLYRFGEDLPVPGMGGTM